MDGNIGQAQTFTVVDWIAEALLKMNERESVARNIQMASTKLDVPQFMAIEALRFLTRLGFIANSGKFKTYLQSRGKGRKLNVDYTQILDQAHKAYVTSVADNHFQHEVFLLEKGEMDKASRILRSALSEIRKPESRSKKSRVVFVANQIFSVENERKKNDKKN